MKKHTRVISFSGKGGTGKTTTASLFVKAVRELGLCEEILVIDADPDANLATTLDVRYETTIGDVADKRKKTLDEGVAGEKLRADIYDAINHGEYFDFVVMGRRKGAGCYCTINGILDAIFAETMNMYDLVLIDFDAGLEHFSRGTGSNSDALIIVCDQSKLSFETAERITDIVDELALPYASRYVVGCRYDEENKPLLEKLAGRLGLDTLGYVDYDREIAALNLAGESLDGLSADNPALESAKRMVKRILCEEE